MSFFRGICKIHVSLEVYEVRSLTRGKELGWA